MYNVIKVKIKTAIMSNKHFVYTFPLYMISLFATFGVCIYYFTILIFEFVIIILLYLSQEGDLLYIITSDILIFPI